MNKNGEPDTLCWDCVKGRHALCTGVIPTTDTDAEDHGKRCECPVCHGNRNAQRQPEWDASKECYYDPGLDAEPPRER